MICMYKILLNQYCIHSTFEAELADVIPVVKTSIGGNRIIGRLCVGELLSASNIMALAFYIHILILITTYL